MSVKIRLSRIGKKHVPFYRVIAVDSRKKRDGAFLANIGTYDGLKSIIIRFDEALYGEWIAKGAQVTDSAEKIYKQFKKIGIGVAKTVKAKPVSSVSVKTSPDKKKAAPKKVAEKPAEAAVEKTVEKTTKTATDKSE